MDTGCSGDNPYEAHYPDNRKPRQIDDGASQMNRYADLHGCIGFNGQLQEPGTAWQLLGNGYRVYNPVLMRFHAPDALSPFKRGGLNSYAYCWSEPINQVDNSGRFPIALLLMGLPEVLGRGAQALADVVSDNPQLRAGLIMLGVVAGLAAVGAIATLRPTRQLIGRVFGRRGQATLSGKTHGGMSLAAENYPWKPDLQLTPQNIPNMTVDDFALHAHLKRVQFAQSRSWARPAPSYVAATRTELGHARRPLSVRGLLPTKENLLRRRLESKYGPFPIDRSPPDERWRPKAPGDARFNAWRGESDA